jgi:hypothetical protein
LPQMVWTCPFLQIRCGSKARSHESLSASKRDRSRFSSDGFKKTRQFGWPRCRRSRDPCEVRRFVGIEALPHLHRPKLTESRVSQTPQRSWKPSAIARHQTQEPHEHMR